MSGERDKALKILHELEGRAKERYIPPLSIANIYAAFGEIDKAFEWTDKAYQEHDTMIAFFKTWPEYENLRLDPRGKALMKKIGLEK
jgi:hypothetical protein